VGVIAAPASVQPHHSAQPVQLDRIDGGSSSRPLDRMAALGTFITVPLLLLVTVGQRKTVTGLTAGATQ